MPSTLALLPRLFHSLFGRLSCLLLRPLLWSRLALAAAALAGTANAWAIYRCETGGSVSYSDIACPGAQVVPEAAPELPNRSQAAQRRLDSQRAELRRMQSERERRQAAEESARQRAEAGRQAHLKRCKLLEMKKRWSEEDAGQANIKQENRAKRAARRKAEQFELECGSAK